MSKKPTFDTKAFLRRYRALNAKLDRLILGLFPQVKAEAAREKRG